MPLILAAVAVLLAGGAGAFLTRRSERYCVWLGCGSVLVASLLVALGLALTWTESLPRSLRYPWAVPFGSLSFALDSLSTWFLLPLLPLAAIAASYGAAYMKDGHGGGAGGRAAGTAWFFLDVLLASMIVVLTAHNAILFLVAWEVMALASFFLVTWDDDRREVREAGWVYLVATHVGTAFLVAMFAEQPRANTASPRRHRTISIR